MVNRDVCFSCEHIERSKVSERIKENYKRKKICKERGTEYYTTKDLAVKLKMSVKWVEKWRHDIVGAYQIGRQWRFNRGQIDFCVAVDKDVRKSKNLAAPWRGIHIPDVRGAVCK